MYNNLTHMYSHYDIICIRTRQHLNNRIWSILTKRRQFGFSGGLSQSNATITCFEGLVG